MVNIKKAGFLISIPFVLLMPLILTGCPGRVLTALTPSPPVYYQLEYTSKPLTCPAPFERGLRIWSFTGSAPYDRREMVVLTASHEVRFSPQNQWVTTPGEMIADRLIQDFSQTDLFPKIVASNDPFAAPLELSGQIYRFAWQEKNSTAQAVLDVDVSLWEEGAKRRVLFRRNYRLQSRTFPESGAPRFAEAMSDLMLQFSDRLRQDLCAMNRGNLSPTAD